MKYVVSIFIGLLYAQPSIGQSDLIERIGFYANMLTTDSSYSNRIKASDSIALHLDTYIAEFDDQISELKGIQGLSVLTDKHDKVAIISWGLYQEPGKSKYFGRVINRTLDKIWTLVDESNKLDDIDYEQLDAENWYGALYYDLIEARKNTYLLIGYNNYDVFNKRKLIEVLTFDNGILTFGAPMFGDRDENYRYYKYRFLYDYATESAAILRFDQEFQAIRFDHLISVKSPNRQQGNMMVPDGTFSGYKLEDGYCYFIDDFSELEKSK